MCKKDDCERHELWGGFCLVHLKESLGVDQPKRKRRTKKVDAIELETTDAEAPVERNDNDK